MVVGLCLSELYTSIQCEGPNVGKLTQFCRFAGCNMRCPGWPCDTQHAINPSIWRHQSEILSSEELSVRILAEVKRSGAKNICITGGEPFLQPNDRLESLVRTLTRLGNQVECFSNGSFPYPEWALSLMPIVMDWKLEGSGEAHTARDIRYNNAALLDGQDSIKFVVKDMPDLEEAHRTWHHLMNRDCQAEFWVGQAWDHISTDDIIQYIGNNRLPWRLNVQLHKFLWDPDKRGV